MSEPLNRSTLSAEGLSILKGLEGGTSVPCDMLLSRYLWAGYIVTAEQLLKMLRELEEELKKPPEEDSHD